MSETYSALFSYIEKLMEQNILEMEYYESKFTLMYKFAINSCCANLPHRVCQLTPYMGQDGTGNIIFLKECHAFVLKGNIIFIPWKVKGRFIFHIGIKKLPTYFVVFIS